MRKERFLVDERQFTCNHCENHCSVSYEVNDKTLANVNGYLCPNGMLCLIKELLPMNQKKGEQQ